MRPIPLFIITITIGAAAALMVARSGVSSFVSFILGMTYMVGAALFVNSGGADSASRISDLGDAS